MTGSAGALWLILMRVGQGFGGAMLFANSAAILTDAFPPDQRGMALGINNVAGITGTTLGLVLGGTLAPVSWRLIFLVSVPVGVFGTVWAYLKLRDLSPRRPARVDWAGNLTFALGLILVMVGITTGIRPAGHHTMGWTSPRVISEIGGGIALLIAFVAVEARVAEPMFNLDLFRIRAFAAGNLASLLAALARGGLQFCLIIWLQGIWLPEHGFAFTDTPLWAGIYMLPMIGGFLLAGPISGALSDRFGARPFATGGMLLAAVSFLLLDRLPVDFPYDVFAVLLLLNGIGMGLFAAPNRAAIMNSVPPDQRGVGSGMSTTFQNAGQVLSIGIFFSLLIIGLAARLPGTLQAGLVAHGVPSAAAAHVAHLPPVSTLLATFLGYNPVQALVGPHVLATLPHAQVAQLTGRAFFPRLLTAPFSDALDAAFTFAMVCCLVAAAASWLRGGKYHWAQEPRAPEPAAGGVTATPVAPERSVVS
jgi:MFS family permease